MGKDISIKDIQEMLDSMCMDKSKEPIRFICGYSFLSALSDDLFMSVVNNQQAKVYCTLDEVEELNKRIERLNINNGK